MDYIITNDNRIYARFTKDRQDVYILVATCPNTKCANMVLSGLGWMDSETTGDYKLEDFIE